MDMTVIIPAYNEGENLANVLRELTGALPTLKVIVVDDGSSDNTAEAAEGVAGVQVIKHPYNKGYGAALKTGIAAVTTEWCMTYDADGQHTPEHVTTLLPHCTDGMDMVIGRRTGYKGPLIRQPGKWLLHIVANRLADRKIPDLNSGLRAFRKTQFLRYAHLFPNGFSISTTSTICYFSEGLHVEYFPITIRKRQGGVSTVRARHAAQVFMLMLRLIMLFSPLRIFLPISIFFGLLTLGSAVYEWVTVGDVVNSSMIALITLTSFTFFFGLLADQVAAIRREIGGMRKNGNG